jgi:DMSO/TMAO reductase YedYZ molybdopterin-dependent catalytic subunit
MFSELHWIPSVIAAVLTILLAFVRNKRWHKAIAFGMAFFALLGLAGYIVVGDFSLFPLGVHTLHAWLGIAALLSSLITFAAAVYFRKKGSPPHHIIGYIAACLSFAALVSGLMMLGGMASLAPASTAAVAGNATNKTLQVPVSNVLSDVEASTFMGVNLTPMSKQLNNAINGTQYINRSTYRLHVTGLVENDLNLSYDELLGLPAYSEVSTLPCVEGWSFTAQWTGFRVIDLLDLAKLEPNATYVVFYGSDGYSTGLPLDYLRDQDTLMAYGINNVTLPPERGFPFQLVAVNKYGYKWAKWITSIDVVNKTVEGYWESRGYSNSANASG